MHDLNEREFGQIAELIREHAMAAPRRPALIDAGGAIARTMDYGELDSHMDRVACALQRDGVAPGQAVAICAGMSIEYAVIFLGALRAGVVVAPLAPGSTPASLTAMLVDCDARLVFGDRAAADVIGATPMEWIALDTTTPGRNLEEWLAPAGTRPAVVDIAPDDPFNVIYSSGTTGEPKGIVQPHGMRWAHVRRGATYAYGTDAVTLLSTPLYSNTTLVVFFPTLTFGGTVVLMPKFDAGAYLRLAEEYRVTHTMLVPVQYQRLMARPDFGEHDLSRFRFKFSTSAPFAAALKADVLARWPGGLVEFYGMTEGGGTCILNAHEYPDKLHTVGMPAEGHDIRLIDDAGNEVARGEAGEVVGHSPGMMTGYHQQPGKTRDAEWFDAADKRFVRTGDVGRFDAEGFLTLFDRKKDMIISGGFNIYPSDLEAVLRTHAAVAEAAVVGVPSRQWGESPVAFVVRKPACEEREDDLRQWLNAQVAKNQRLAALCFVDELPRSAIGKVLKRELRDRHGGVA